MIYIETGSTDVYYNFGLEHYFATEKRLPDTVFLFWRTTPTLMVGKLYFLYFISFVFSYFEINTYVCVTLN